MIVAGIPDRPTARDDAEQVVAHFRVLVPWPAAGRMLTAPCTLDDVLAPLRGEVRRAAERVAHWWNAQAAA